MKLFRNPPESQILHLLAESMLPTADLPSGQFEHFFGCGNAQMLEGVVGLEIYGTVALLRSLAVAKDGRGAGRGKALVAAAESHARSNGVTELYLLTTTAEQFFERLGYARAAREDAPGPIHSTQEFSGLCPVSAAFMVKRL